MPISLITMSMISYHLLCPWRTWTTKRGNGQAVMVKDHAFGNISDDPSVWGLSSELHYLAGMVLHHVDVDDPELLGEGRQGRRRPPEDEFIVMDVLIFCLVLHGRKSTSSFVMLLVMIAEMMAMSVILMMMTNELHLRNLEKRERVDTPSWALWGWLPLRLIRSHCWAGWFSKRIRLHMFFLVKFTYLEQQGTVGSEGGGGG